MNMKKKIKILAVDDNQSNLIALESVFFGTAYELIEANSGEQALALLQVHHDIALVLLDVQMPVMDGFETASKIKKMEGCGDLPIIFITAFYREDPFIRRGYESGAIDYFSKPFDPEILKLKVDMYASFRQKAFLLKERELRILETEELLKAGKRLSQVFENLTVGVLISDQNGKIFQCNEFASQILNATTAEREDQYGEIIKWWETNGLELKEVGGPLWISLNESKSAHNVSINLPCMDGNSKNILVSSSPLVGNDGQTVGAVLVLQDLTESKKIEADFELKISQLISLSVELEHATIQNN